jgi:transposase, IS5 family
MAGRVRQVVKQTKVRIFDGITQLPGKIVSLFEPHSEIIRKGKASKPTEFGKLVQVQETENQIIPPPLLIIGRGHSACDRTHRRAAPGRKM